MQTHAAVHATTHERLGPRCDMLQANCDFRLRMLAKALEERRLGGQDAVASTSRSNEFVAISDIERIEMIAQRHGENCVRKPILWQGPRLTPPPAAGPLGIIDCDHSAADLPVDGSQSAIDSCEDYLRQVERILVSLRQNSGRSVRRRACNGALWRKRVLTLALTV